MILIETYIFEKDLNVSAKKIDKWLLFGQKNTDRYI